jgi:hypothetical protein
MDDASHEDDCKSERVKQVGCLINVMCLYSFDDNSDDVPNLLEMSCILPRKGSHKGPMITLH